MVTSRSPMGIGPSIHERVSTNRSAISFIVALSSFVANASTDTARQIGARQSIAAYKSHFKPIHCCKVNINSERLRAEEERRHVT